MRVAAIDIGTNSVLLLVAERSPDGLRAVCERSTITRLGQGVDRTRRLHPDAVSRTLDCLRDYATILREQGAARISVVGTSASRDAEGACEFVKAAGQILGTAPTVISGEREAELTFSGALSGLSLEGQVAVQDVGGGSTEIVLGEVRAGRPVAHRAVSLDVGSVRMTERFLASDPPSAAELKALREHVRGVLLGAPSASAGVQWVGIAGTITTLLSVQLGMHPYDGAKVHGATLTLRSLEAIGSRLAAMTLVDRRKVIGLEPKRADVIVAGACIVSEVLAHQEAASMMVSDRGVRWGLALELARG
jgi:exopolyphosphatase / guanosine-5'-triphosphate,3'-diphosphate pyrophosphatase